MNIYYIHLREHDPNKLDEKGEPVLLNFGGATVAYTIHRLADSLHVKYAVAECTINDRFVKEIGRQISKARLLEDQLMGEMQVSNALTESEIEQLIYVNYCEYKKDFYDYDEGMSIEDFLYPHHKSWKDDVDAS